MDFQALALPISILNIIIIIAIVCFQKRNPISSVAWIMCMLLFPVIGGILFLVFGVGVKSYVRYRYLKKQELNENPILSHQRELAKKAGDDGRIAGLVKYFLNLGYVYSENNRVEIFTNAQKKYEALFADIEAAKESINIMYFIIRNDVVGNRLIDLLCKKAEEGVCVRLMYDGFGSLLTPRRLFNRLRNISGSSVVEFFPVQILSLSKINHRNHRKIVVIDDKIAYMGGMNVGDEYMGKAKKRKLNWRDTHLKIVGEAAFYVAQCFANDWEFSTGAEIPIKEPEVQNEAEGVPMQIVASGPDTMCEEIKCGMIKMLYSARQYAYLQTPYFVPDEPFMEAVKTAVRSGADVRVMIPGVPDKKYVYHTTMSYVGELLEEGVRVYLYPGFIHSKTLAVDDVMSTVGTTNADIRSFRLLFEINSFMYSQKLAEDCRVIFEKDMSVCHELTLEEYKKRGLFKVIREGFFRLFSPIF